MFHRTYTCKIVNKSSQNSLKTLSLKNDLRDGTIVLSSTLSSFKSMMADNKPHRVHLLNGIIYQYAGAIYHCLRGCYEK